MSSFAEEENHDDARALAVSGKQKPGKNKRQVAKKLTKALERMSISKTGPTVMKASSRATPRSNSAPEPMVDNPMNSVCFPSDPMQRSMSLPPKFELQLDFDEEFDISNIVGGGEGGTTVMIVNEEDSEEGLSSVFMDSGAIVFENPTLRGKSSSQRNFTRDVLKLRRAESLSAEAAIAAVVTAAAAAAAAAATAAVGSGSISATPSTSSSTTTTRAPATQHANAISKDARSHQFTPLPVEVRFDERRLASMPLWKYCLLNLAEYHYLLRIFFG